MATSSSREAGYGRSTAKLLSFVKDNRLPGAAAGVVHGNELAWSDAIGFAGTATRQPTQPGTLYRIASVTKDVHRNGHHAAS